MFPASYVNTHSGIDPLIKLWVKLFFKYIKTMSHVCEVTECLAERTVMTCCCMSVCRRPPEALSDCISLSRRSSSAAFLSSSSCLFSSSAAPLVCSYTHTHVENTHQHTGEGTGVCVRLLGRLFSSSLDKFSVSSFRSIQFSTGAAGGDVTTTCSQELCLQTRFCPPAAWISPAASHR